MRATADHLRTALDGRWHDVKTRVRRILSDEVFRPHYAPNTVIAHAKVAEQLTIMAGAGAAADGFSSRRSRGRMRCSPPRTSWWPSAMICRAPTRPIRKSSASWRPAPPV